MTPESIPTRSELVVSAIQSWTKQLIDLGGRNRLLYYRDLKVGTLDLTDALGDNVAVCQGLLSGQSVSLSQLLAEELASEQAEPQEADRGRWERRARALHAKAKENDEEKGLRTLQLAWGLATWTSDRSTAVPSAPIVLCPMKLEPSGAAGREFVLSRNGEWTVNVALLHVLRLDFDLEPSEAALDAALEELEATHQPDQVFRVLQDAYAGLPDFSVSDRRVLANFSYAKLPVAVDLEASLERLVDLDLIAAIAGDEEAKDVLRAQLLANADDTSGELAPEDEFLVLDADSSQSAAINTVVKGSNTVIQGPPGTGKSQSIANLIATLVARGKKVLFVAEKRAAIDAVLRRLDDVGLGNLVLDLHDGTSNRKRIAEGLAEALGRAASTPLPDVSEQQRQLTSRRDALNQHVRALHESRQPWGVSAYEAQCEMCGIQEPLQSGQRIRRASLLGLGAATFRECSEALHEYVAHGGPGIAREARPWAYALRSSAVPTSQHAEATLAAIEQLRHATLPALAAAVTETTPVVGTPGSGRICDWAVVPGVVASTAETLMHLSGAVWRCDLENLLGRLKPGLKGGVGGLATRIRDGQFRAARKEARSLCVAPPRDLPELVRWLEQAHRSLVAWRGLGVRQAIPLGYPDEVSRLEGALDSTAADLARLGTITNADCSQVSCAEAIGYVDHLLASREVLYRLPELTRWRQTLIAKHLGDVLEEIDTVCPTSGSDAVATLRYIWLASIVEAVSMADSTLGTFDGRAQDELVEEFRKLDREQIALASARVQRTCAEGLMRVRDQYTRESELVVRQAMLKRRHMPMREFLPRAANVLLALKPCWAMSPLIVSQVLPSDTLFDVVIFDEASQVPPCDAIPSVSRGRQVVVAGDRKQLPPTTFFMSADDGAAEEEVDWDDSRLTTVDLESVLDLMTNILPAPHGTRTLMWHYRSRDERLIAFSNASFYGSNLTTFPGVDSDACVRHVLVPSSLGVPGQEESGSAEVRRIVELVAEHARERPGESLGVIAMGIKHADRITEAVYQARPDLPELEPFLAAHLDEPFFVKNLERVQGDERDAIVLTVGYGKTSDGRMLYRFGPLNNEGGERRLNVAVTRAKRRMTVVSSFAADEMDPDRLKKEGPRRLKEYLEYAASGGRAVSRRIAEQAALNPFEMDVGERLEGAGIPLVPQYGVSGYYIDFAARHRDLPGKMILAIECDGDRYHRSPSARDRDRLRQDHLERLGWRFVRIWSSEWSRNPDAQVDRVLQAYEQAMRDCQNEAEPAAGSAPPPPLPVGATDSSTTDGASVHREGVRPNVPFGPPIGDYSLHDLVTLLKWIQSDTLLRTRDEMVAELIEELGFMRRGKRVVAACEQAVDRYLEDADPERLRAARAAGVDGMSRQGVKVAWDTSVGWHYQDSRREVGPVSWTELWELARQGVVRPETQVWHKAVGQWRPAGDTPGLFI